MADDKPTYKYKPCPFRQGHYCSNCELLNPDTDQCTFKLINWNLGIIAKALLGDKEGAKKIQKGISRE